ncbi:unnamed protein product [Urochloa humidicola]
MATCSRAPPPAPILAAGLAGPGMKGGPSEPAPEEEAVVMKPSAALAPAADLARPAPGRRFRPRVPMTEEEEEKLVEVKVRHMSGWKELQARIERRDELRRRLDEVLFQRRGWAATLANQVVGLRADIARARQQKEGKPLLEKLDDAFIMNEHIGRVMDMGLDAFAEDYCKFYENQKKMRLSGSRGSC